MAGVSQKEVGDTEDSEEGEEEETVSGWDRGRAVQRPHLLRLFQGEHVGVSETEEYGPDRATLADNTGTTPTSTCIYFHIFSSNCISILRFPFLKAIQLLL